MARIHWGIVPVFLGRTELTHFGNLAGFLSLLNLHMPLLHFIFLFVSKPHSSPEQASAVFTLRHMRTPVSHCASYPFAKIMQIKNNPNLVGVACDWEAIG